MHRFDFLIFVWPINRYSIVCFEFQLNPFFRIDFVSDNNV
jgi:hypothetical protein